MATRRTQRVGESIREVLGELIQRSVKDPRIGFVTITAVRVTPDLSRADVYYTVLGDELERSSTQAGLESATPFLRSETGRRVRLKTLPELEFHVDDAPIEGRRVDSILDEIHKTEAAHPGFHLPVLSADVEANLNKAIQVIEGASSIGIACHVAPDGDALGSLLALALALNDRGIPIQPSWDGDPVRLPTQYDFLPGAELLVKTNDFRPPEVSIAVDCAAAERLGRLEDRVKKAKVVVNIDHHPNKKFGAVNIVDETASSSAELVTQLLSRMGAEITPQIATCLYTGLVTDTGRFAYASVAPRTHATAAFLLQRGVRVDEVSQKLYDSYRFGYLKILGRALERATLEDDPRFVLSYLTKADRDEIGVTMEDTDDVIDTLRAIRDCDVTVLFKELDDGTWKGSFRSKGDTDVGSIASRLGGGGHRLAAGFSLAMPLEQAIESVREALREAQS
ncbi:MAG: 30S ribosome-binding factor RbfA [Actinomycetota bacterium]